MMVARLIGVMIDKADSGAQATAKFWVLCIWSALVVGSLSDILRISI